MKQMKIFNFYIKKMKFIFNNNNWILKINHIFNN